MDFEQAVELTRSELVEDIGELYEHTIRCEGQISYQVYIWDDGEIEYMECVGGEHTWLEPKNSESRSLYYIGTLSCDCDWRDLCYELPYEDEDPNGYETAKNDAVASIVAGFDPEVWLNEQIEAHHRDEGCWADWIG